MLTILVDFGGVGCGIQSSTFMLEMSTRKPTKKSEGIIINECWVTVDSKTVQNRTKALWGNDNKSNKRNYSCINYITILLG